MICFDSFQCVDFKLRYYKSEMYFFVILVVCFNAVLSKIPPGLNQEKHLDMREEGNGKFYLIYLLFIYLIR